MRHTVEPRQASNWGTLALVLLGLALCAPAARLLLLWIVRGDAAGLRVVPAQWFATSSPLIVGLWALLVALRRTVGAHEHLLVETDAWERVLRRERRRPWATRIDRHPYDEICEILVEPCRRTGMAAGWRLQLVRRDGDRHPLVEFSSRDEARDVAARLADEAGCLVCESPFRLTPEPETSGEEGAILPSLLIAGFYGAIRLHDVWQAGRIQPDWPEVARETLAFFLVLAGTFLSGLWLTRWGQPGRLIVRVRNDPEGRVMHVQRGRRVLGWTTRSHPYDDISAIVAEAEQPDETGPAAEWPAFYRVRIVPRNMPWDGLGDSDLPRDDTVFRSRDRDEARLTAERLARRIGRPWRDATA